MSITPRALLACPTPDAWLTAAREDLGTLLIDHANCELKAASTALGFIYRYPADRGLGVRMSRLAREELRHYEQVQNLLARRGVLPAAVSASRYAAGLRRDAAREEPGRLLDNLLIGAFIEARSWERFDALSGVVDGELARFYEQLLASEARHFEAYIDLVRERAPANYPLEERLALLRARDAELVTAPDAELRFHSGPPVAQGRGSA